jgi:ABC-type antimicrobial peptide transport system permease subunit
MGNALKSLKRIKLIAFLTILQLSIGLTLLNTGSIIKQENENKPKNLERLFDFENTYLVETKVYDNKNSKSDKIITSADFNKIEKSYNALTDLKDKGIIFNNFIYYCGGGGNPIISSEGSAGKSDIAKEYLPEEYHNLDENTLIRNTSEININEEFFNLYKINIVEGRNFTSSDFNINSKEEPIPMIIGLDYKDKISIGDEFKYSVPDIDGGLINIKYKVIGFYDHNDMVMLGSKGKYVDGVTFSDAFVITPVVNDVLFLSNKVIMAQYGIWVNVPNSNSMDKVVDTLLPILEDDGFSLEITNMKDEVNRTKEVLEKSSVNASVLGLALTILSVMGVSSVMIGEINKRKKEFGIRITQGATLNTVSKEIFFEILLMSVFAGIVSLILIFLTDSNLLTIKIILKNLLTVIVIVSLISIIPILSLRRFNPIDLVKTY